MKRLYLDASCIIFITELRYRSAPKGPSTATQKSSLPPDSVWHMHMLKDRRKQVGLPALEERNQG